MTRWPMSRWMCLGLGAALCLTAWTWSDPLAPWPFVWHMARHMTVVAIATALIAMALAPMGLGAALPPLAAAALEFIAVWGWHLPAAHEFAQTTTTGFIAEQASFFAAGLALWLSVLQPGRALAGAGGLLLTSMHMTLLGTLLILAKAPLYPAAICGGLADQQVGGMLMLGIGTPIYLLAGLALVARLLRPNHASKSEAA